MTHSADPGGANLPMNLTNLHTHGLIVQARAPTLSDPTFGDYVFVEIYNPANGIPVPQTTHQHGSIVPVICRLSDRHPGQSSRRRVLVPSARARDRAQPGVEGLAGIISIGSVGQYAHGDTTNAPFPDANVRHLVLKDMQVLAAGNIMFDNGPADVANGEVLEPGGPGFLQPISLAVHRGAPGLLPGRRQLPRRR